MLSLFSFQTPFSRRVRRVPPWRSVLLLRCDCAVTLCPPNPLPEQEPAERDGGNDAGEIGEQPGRDRVPGPGDVD